MFNNNYFEQIKSDSYLFLYNQIYNNQIGDINGDSEINVLDIINLVNIILNIEDINSWSDINQDGTVDILDVIQLVNIILDIN